LKNKYLFIFAITIFLVLSITGAGIFLNDEWMVGQELNQLSQGHQLLHNEGKYGYYANGTSGVYMMQRNNVLIYPLILPILSLPALALFGILSTDFTRIFIICLWGIFGLYSLYYIKDIINNEKIIYILSCVIASFTFLNIIISSPFTMSGINIPYEILPIVFTNILLYGIFSVLCFKISELLFEEKFKQFIGWISCISLSTLLFWSTTLKDHVLLATFIIAICYLHVQYQSNNKEWYLYIKYLLSGLCIWSRPEIGLFVTIGIILFDIYYFRYPIKKIIILISCSLIGVILMIINNFVITGNPLSSPFLASSINQVFITKANNMTTTISANITSSNMLNNLLVAPFQIFYAQTNADVPMRWVYLFFSPESGALGLIVPLCLFIFGILLYIKYRPTISTNAKFLLMVGVASIFYYISYSGPYLGADGGVVPDIRYFTAAYATLTLFALTLIPYDLNYRKIFKNIFIIAPIVIIICLFIISVYSPAGETYKSFRMIPHIISTLSLSIMLILLVNDQNTKPNKTLEWIIPVVISSAFTWQVIMVFVYHISKAHYYPFFLPATELLYKLLFGV
jgi:hypothetical protein